MIDAWITLSIISFFAVVGMSCIMYDIINPERIVVVRRKINKPLKTKIYDTSDDVFDL